MKYEYVLSEIKINNFYNDCSIKSIQIYLADCNKNKSNIKWYKLHKYPIININKNDKHSEQYQSFNIEPIIDYKSMFINKLLLIKIEILDNYGGKQNALKSLQFCGKRIYYSECI